MAFEPSLSSSRILALKIFLAVSHFVGNLGYMFVIFLHLSDCFDGCFGAVVADPLVAEAKWKAKIPLFRATAALSAADKFKVVPAVSDSPSPMTITFFADLINSTAKCDAAVDVGDWAFLSNRCHFSLLS